MFVPGPSGPKPASERSGTGVRTLTPLAAALEVMKGLPPTDLLVGISILGRIVVVDAVVLYVREGSSR